MARSLNILILGGAGAQNSYVAQELAQAGHKVRILSRDTEKEEPKKLAALSGIEVVKGDTYDEEVLISAFKNIDSVFVNTNGFAIGEKSEIYWSIRIYEIALWAGVKHFIYSTLPYVSKKSGFNPKFRVPFVDGKAKFGGMEPSLSLTELLLIAFIRLSQVPANRCHELEPVGKRPIR